MIVCRGPLKYELYILLCHVFLGVWSYCPLSCLFLVAYTSLGHHNICPTIQSTQMQIRKQEKTTIHGYKSKRFVLCYPIMEYMMFRPHYWVVKWNFNFEILCKVMKSKNKAHDSPSKMSARSVHSRVG